MLLLWALMWGLSASPDLHRLLHQDAQNPEHHCVATQLQHKSVLTGFVAVVVPAAPSGTLCPLHPCDARVVTLFDGRLSQSRAPPAA